MPFSIGAGDANVEKGYIGEYATRWNKRAYDENPMHEIKQTLFGTIKPLGQTVELLEQRNKKLEQENEELKRIVKRTKQWRVNENIKSPFANISGLCCVHCDHKDEYIIELEEENEKLKRLLKMAADELEEKMNNLCEVTSYCSTYSACTQCLYSQVCADVEDYSGGARWIHMDEVDKLLKGEENA